MTAPAASLRAWLQREQRVAVHGLSGQAARQQLSPMRAAGTNVVAGVVPGRGGGEVDGVPVFDDLRQAVRATGCNASVLFVPPGQVRQACIEVVGQGIRLAAVLTEGVPALDALSVRAARADTLLVGPNSPGLAVPGVAKLGFMPSVLLHAGHVALISRSGTLSYEVALELRRQGLGLSLWLGVGGDPAPLLDMAEAAEIALADPETAALAVVGEVGGTAEERLADWLALRPHPPVHVLLVGRTAPAEAPVGHAGAVVRGRVGTYGAKAERLRAAGAAVHATPWELARAVAGGRSA